MLDPLEEEVPSPAASLTLALEVGWEDITGKFSWLPT